MLRLQKLNSAGASAKVIGGLSLRTVLLSTIALTPAMYANVAKAAAPAAPQPAAVEEVVVTGTRIVREGYEAPTPLSVIDASALDNRSDPNLAKLLTQMPAFSGAGLSQSNPQALSPGTAGIDQVNLRNLGTARTLVLLDGQRTVGSAPSGQGVDISSFPQQLVARVDVVTGGASAVYGSDAVAGVVNFILDKKFTGVRGDISGGITNYGDAQTFSLKLSAGFGFAGDRGHVLLSGNEEYNGGSHGDGGRKWDRNNWQVVPNPTYTATNGQPAFYQMSHVGLNNETLGGVVVAGPLKGLAFGENGTPYILNQGNFQSGNQFTGGDWQSTDARILTDLIQKEKKQNVFVRVGYDVTDNINAYVQSFWTRSFVTGFSGLDYTVTPASEPVIKVDNAFLPASVKAAMIAKGVTQFQTGSWNLDVGPVYTVDTRTLLQNNVGLDGNFDAFNSNWKWDLHGSYGIALPTVNITNVFVSSNFALATDAVVDPSTGATVCRIKLTDPKNPCQPWNPLGIGVNANNKVGLEYIMGTSKDLGNGQILATTSHNKVESGDFAGSLSGEPFSLPAGPVSLALSLEHRIDTVHDVPDLISQAVGHIKGNPPFLSGKVTVTEGAAETVVPLFKDVPFAVNWDVNAAVRGTNYSQSGYVTTWKVGTTYAPIDDIKFRGTRSSDIRAPNIQELFNPVTSGFGNVQDPFTNTRPIYKIYQTGNIDLKPETATTTGIGVVLTPRFLDGFTGSVDYWDVNVKGGIQSVSAQSVVNTCYDKTHPELCANIVRVNGVIDLIKTGQQNVGLQDTRGLDVEASYRFNLANMLSGLDGDVALHSNATFYLRNFQQDKIAPDSNFIGINNGSSGPPSWKVVVSANYQLDPFTVILTGRAISAGKLSGSYLECSSACPASTTALQTIDNNHLPGKIYIDTNFQYAFEVGGAQTTAYFSARNIFNESPPAIATTNVYTNAAAPVAGLYDVNGTVFRAGLRFKL